MDIVIVESPAKAKTINKYLGDGFTVLASYGHVRDLSPKDGSVDPEQDFNMVWQIGDKSQQRLKAIAEAAKGAKHLYLATDPDREGEAISWHVREELEQRNVLNGVNVKRIVFHEVTRDAVLEAIQQPRDLDDGLIQAYLARRALDYLVGFTLSPLLWRKLPGSRSAGRVQSVALRLICERESEIEVFLPQEYWTVEAIFDTVRGSKLITRLTHLDGIKLDRYALSTQADAQNATNTLQNTSFSVEKIDRKSVARNPHPPFTTSTLQQEASRKLGFGTTRTMRTAQKLYEGIDIGGETVGLITYMRTDSVYIAQEAVIACRSLIGNMFGTEYVPTKPNTYRNKSKNAQEAHEAIRPTDVTHLPNYLAQFLDEDGRRLYELIWKRTVASAMKSAALEQVTIDVVSDDKKTALRATGSIIKFDGFLKLYKEDRDDPSEDDPNGENILPRVTEGESLANGPIKSGQHYTKPPPRYTEASLVRKMEELGIGRPSTYASIISVLQDRDYVRLESRRFIPEDRGRVVTAFLSGYFTKYIEYNFTAELEDKLDSIANGDVAWKGVLSEFWEAFYLAVKKIEPLKISDVIDTLDADLGSHFFPKLENGEATRNCPVCKSGRLGLKLGRGGPFIGCSNYPECNYTRALSAQDEEDTDTASLSLPKLLGTDPETKKEVTLRKGPFGFYIQLGEPEDKKKPKRATVIKSISPVDITLDIALALLALPRDIGAHPETGEKIAAGIGRFGPYLKLGSAFVSLGADEDVLSIGLNRAVAIIKEKPPKKTNSPLRELGTHPADGKPVNIFKGRYGPYVKHGRINASIPKSEKEETITLEQAVELLTARAAKGKSPKGAKKKKATSKKKVNGEKKISSTTTTA